MEQQCILLEQQGLLLRSINIEACAVWDTVASIGLPDTGMVPNGWRQKAACLGDEVCPNIKTAIQALALDEKRRPFSPLVWKRPLHSQVLKQSWFSATHGDVGGGNKNPGLANISLLWMVAQLKDIIEFDLEAVKRLTLDKVIRFEHTVTPLSCSVGPLLCSACREKRLSSVKVHESRRGIHKLGGVRRRKPGLYNPLPAPSSPNNEAELEPPIHPHETIHCSVRYLQSYHPVRGMKRYERDSGMMVAPAWKLRKPRTPAEHRLRILEDEPSAFELELFAAYLDVDLNKETEEVENFNGVHQSLRFNIGNGGGGARSLQECVRAFMDPAIKLRLVQRSTKRAGCQLQLVIPVPTECSLAMLALANSTAIALLCAKAVREKRLAKRESMVEEGSRLLELGA